jgi:hypothetical protein
MLNSHLFHVCPSQYEGWGHCLHEGLGVGAVVLTTDAPPMSYFVDPNFRMQCVLDGEHFLAPLYSASLEAIAEKVDYLMSLSDDAISEIGTNNMKRFAACRDEFRSRLDSLIGTFAGEIACAS